jgi:hypothetical protein
MFILCVLAIVNLLSKKSLVQVMDGRVNREICAVPP